MDTNFIEPRDDSGNIDRCCDQDILQMRFGLSDITCSPQTERPRARFTKPSPILAGASIIHQIWPLLAVRRAGHTPYFLTKPKCQSSEANEINHPPSPSNTEIPALILTHFTTPGLFLLSSD